MNDDMEVTMHPESVQETLDRLILENMSDRILPFFRFAHLPPHLAMVSEQYAALACGIIGDLPRNAERTVALRKLLESKDAGVRAKLAGAEDIGASVAAK